MKLRHHVTTLNFEFPYTEIHGSSFPPRRQLVSSSPISAGFCPSSSMFSILTALFVCSSLVCAWIDSPSSLLAYSHPHPLSRLVPVCACFHLSLSTFAVLTPHLPPHLQAVLTTDPQAYAYLCVLSSSLISVCCIHTPPLPSPLSLIGVHCTHTLLSRKLALYSSLIYVRRTHHPPCSPCLQVVDVLDSSFCSWLGSLYVYISCLIILNTIWGFLISIVFLVQKNDQLPIQGIKYCEPVAFIDQKQCRLQSPGSPGSFCRHDTTGTIYHVQEATNATEIYRMIMETMHQGTCVPRYSRY